ncbi:hypothetical protein SODALDRAFT_311190 [Sodiomyces alkalinus F11]|uniref:Hemerythrin-like domain-containing protein n=1 Tax=Sodiomyces alkalinus (strain CBS 110278 / VKM F-3762 / F11) TaxID=1314773 RepID=A0A3N2PVD1_SODAK|nr:hypothetical protein SODALDRAFT_311190 [Sodiomyces alkalinus F11]ROT38457.1 hypothetical protein SODALDRAFT_311190 [Sodiomyces alkalinus F11]
MSSSQSPTGSATAGASDPETTTSGTSRSAAVQSEPLPPLSPADFRVYNRLAEKMDFFHDNFRRTWTTLHTTATSNTRLHGKALRSFIDQSLYFLQMLKAHHDIEETYVFPVLARKMPQFRTGEKSDDAAAELLRQHREIHRGMDALETYLRACRSGEEEGLDMARVRELMDSWGTVLWRHLDQEVETLGAENMRRYWTLEEVRRLPM